MISIIIIMHLCLLRQMCEVRLTLKLTHDDEHAIFLSSSCITSFHGVAIHFYLDC